MGLARIGGVTLVGLLVVNIHGEVVHIIHTGPECFLSRDGAVVICDRLSDKARMLDHGTESNTITLVNSSTASSS